MVFIQKRLGYAAVATDGLIPYEYEISFRLNKVSL